MHVCIPGCGQYGRLASFGRFSCTFKRFMPIWKPFMAWMAAWALAGLSKLTKPADERETESAVHVCVSYSPCSITATNVHIYSFLIHVEGNGQQILKETNRLRGLNQIKLMGARGRDFCAGIVFPRAGCVVWGEWI